jgi:hypothetical protein
MVEGVGKRAVLKGQRPTKATIVNSPEDDSCSGTRGANCEKGNPREQRRSMCRDTRWSVDCRDERFKKSLQWRHSVTMVRRSSRNRCNDLLPSIFPALGFHLFARVCTPFVTTCVSGNRQSLVGCIRPHCFCLSSHLQCALFDCLTCMTCSSAAESSPSSRDSSVGPTLLG